MWKVVRMPLKKQSKKRFTDKQWTKAFQDNKCPYGCSLFERTCEHVEEMLPDRRRQTVRMVYRDSMDHLSMDVDNAPTLSEQVLEMQTRLSGYALNELEIDILVCKFVYKHSLRDIAEDLGFSSHSTVNLLYKQALDKLKQKGFRL